MQLMTEVARHGQDVGLEWLQRHGMGPGGEFKMGFHRIPSMHQLHLHVISQVGPAHCGNSPKGTWAMLGTQCCQLSRLQPCRVRNAISPPGFLIHVHTHLARSTSGRHLTFSDDPAQLYKTASSLPLQRAVVMRHDVCSCCLCT